MLIGDPKQLPATVISENTQNNYNLSLFERLTKNFHFPIFLTLSTGNYGICLRLLDVIPRSLPSPIYVSMKENYKMERMSKEIPIAISFMKVTFSTFVFSRHLMFSQLFFIICVVKEFRNTKMN